MIYVLNNNIFPLFFYYKFIIVTSLTKRKVEGNYFLILLLF